MWFDRLTQTKVKKLPDLVEIGRFQWAGKNIECLNGHSPIQSGELLVGDGSGRCQLLSGSYSFILPQKDKNADIDLFNNSISTIGRQLEANKKLISPMLPATVIDSESRLLPLEELLEDTLSKGHLHQISRNPRLDIRYAVEVTDVARAKRLAKGAFVHLASHSECWQRQTLSGIVPKKVKARFSEDDFNIYENIVYVRLLDKLDRHVNLRINTIERLNGTLEEALEFYSDSAALHHKLQNKICTLWGQVFDEETTTETLGLLEDTLIRLREMQLSIRNLKQSALYLKVARHAQVGGALHRTNILNHDSHYRHVATLWDELSKHQQKSVRTPTECFQDGQQLIEQYSRFVGLVLQQAIQPYLEKQIKNTFDGTELSFDWAGRTLAVKREEFDWKLVVIDEDGKQEILLNLVSWLSFTDYPVTKSTSANTLIAWPSLDQISSQQAISNSGGIAISPMDLYCIERLGWYIDKKLNQLLVANYAKPIEKIPQEPVKWIQKQELDKSIELINTQPPSLKILEDLNKGNLSDLDDRLDNSNAVVQKQAVNKRVMEIRALQYCPVCESKANRLYGQSKDCFRVECSICQSNRYLKIFDGSLHFEIQLASDNSFAARGRWHQ
ncbi:hypothetical protein [Marinomonas sp. PE14-40]|uniref:hypothetical protein n=1 Tax=Marinomonas sp. PE14-40 TaxID=3060621 RepID=UPI003F6703FE